MTIYDVENFLLKVGASKYRDEAVVKEFPDFSSISHFGIGILTCFMIANDIDIVTNSEEQEDANSINLRKVNGSYLLRKISKSELDARIKSHGTMVKLYVRSDVDMSSLEEDLKKWIVLPEIPVYLTYGEGNETKIGHDSLKDILVNYLNEVGKTVDGRKYDVYEKKQGKVTVAYAVKHLRYLSEWCLMEVENIRLPKKVLPIGTCIEGIRVEFTTPGYNNSSILAIANIKNSKYQTNVARSAIELDANGEILANIYDIYREHIQEQMNSLEKMNYSKAWALSEGRYLMRPLVYYDYSSNRAEPMDEDILIQRLAKIKSITMENNGVRSIVSAEQGYEMSEINLFECRMTQTAEYLLKEIKSEATLFDLIGVVCSENNFLRGIDNVICNYEASNILHQYALSNKEVSRIKVGHKQRRIQITYALKEDRWYAFNLGSRNTGRKVFIPKTEFIMEGLEDEIGIKTTKEIYIRSDGELYRYIIKVIKNFLREDTEENRRLLEIFLGNIFDSRILEQVYSEDVNTNSVFREITEDSFMRVSENLLQKMWSKIDVEEFTKIVLTRNYSIYSIDNWSRNDHKESVNYFM